VTTAYQDLELRFHRHSVLQGAMAVLNWDSAVMMPPGGASARSDQLAELALVCHRILTAPEIAELLSIAEAEAGGLDAWQSANLKEMRRRWLHANVVPANLVRELSEACSKCEMVWRDARLENDFPAVRPHLEKVVELTRQSAQAKSESLECTPYDALLDQYDPGSRLGKIEPVFDKLFGFLKSFVGEAMEFQARQPDPTQIRGIFDINAQQRLGEKLMRCLGFDFEGGRLDTSHHPFTGGIPEDVRLTTRFDESDFTSGLMAVLHETGHALYESGLPIKWRHQPVGASQGMTVHESQSLIIEMQACRSDGFIRSLAPLLHDAFGGIGDEWKAANLIRLYRRVQPDLIRVDADEVTYPLHVIMRFQLEQSLVSGELRVADLPDAWRESMRQGLGIAPEDDRNGCLQDIHWFSGGFGYFPTYTLGAIAAAQLFDTAQRDNPNIQASLGQGDFKPLLSWLRTHVHGYASRYSPDEILLRATGRSFDVETFKVHLKNRYLN
jgi:carboxypeptidase Taq